MPRSADDVETFLYGLNRNFDSQGDGLFLVSTGLDGPPIVVYVDDTLVVIRADIGKVPDDEKLQRDVYRQLLIYNNTELVHAAYGLEGGEIVLSAGLALANVDQNELAAVLSDIELALARHIRTLHNLSTN